MAGIGGQTAVYGNSTVDFQSYAGPGDKALRNDEVRGYQPVSRIGEVVVNSFVDSYEFASLPSTITRTQLTGREGDALGGQRGADDVEFKPHCARLLPIICMRPNRKRS